MLNFHRCLTESCLTCLSVIILLQMAEQIPFSIAESLLTKLASFVSQEISLVYGFTKDLRRLESTLSSINAILLDAEKKQEESHAVKVWIKRLREVVYDADDLLDDVATEGLRRKVEIQGRMVRKVCDFFSSSNQIAFRFKMGHRIKDIRERIDEVAKEMSSLGFISRKELEVDMPVKNSWRETDSFVEGSEMIGRDGDKEKIIESLLCLENEESVSVVAIVGFGGLGKTALAQLVFNDNNVIKHFDPKMWVCVSEEFDVKILVKNILKSVGKKDLDDLGLDQLQSNLREKIEGKRYLLVLDDVWNENIDKWNNLKKYLSIGARGSKILVTTRSKRVALAMGADFSHDLAVLTEGQSLFLFKKLAFKEGQEISNSKLKIGEEIVRKCKGVPLAIKTLGSMMRSISSESEWLSVLKNDVWKLLEGKSDIGPVLKLSYDHLPNYLRQCFAYCAMFPKDYNFGKEMLIELWMAQGYVHSWSQSGNKSLEEIGDEYFKELLFRSFFQKEGYNYKMHDLIHDLAQSIAGNRCIVANDNSKDVADEIQHMYFEALPSEEYLRKLEGKGLRSLNFSDGLGISSDGIISNFKSLRAFCIRRWDIIELTDSIGKLKHLRYLQMSAVYKIKSLPNSICSLYNLQTLILMDCWALKELPRDLRKLVCLRHLDIAYCDSLECIVPIPKYSSSFSSASTTTFFPSLKFLDLLNCPNLKGWWRTWKDAEPLPQFACLSQLIIVDCPNLTLMPTFPSLEKELWLCNANIRPLDQTLNVKMMGATASALPSTSSSPSSSVAAPLSKLKSLVLEGIENVASLPGEWMRNLTSIEYLQISRCPNLTSLPKEMCHITTLQELNIDHCPHLSERCGHHEAADWSNIAHIPNIVIDGRDIQKEGCYLLEEEGSSSSTEQE
ncbi:putative disease resistance protein RGA3 isoform X2 [Hevea brasiliensis]|uniref:putative disease resistance protein RGA3 isoform X2 n=1 Tax=Hevea brasiliensis TaxID=3981 RepID=UPI0025FC38CA|nr:putative disease resistance protein RGA3 isoform X2 [Hevea brasiliensis]